jgi:signal transduction histidine kinase
VEQAATNSPEMAAKMNSYKNNLMVVLALFQVGFSVITFIACLLFSHKIAGPIYKVQKYLSAIRDREGNGKLFFRNGDYFQELADDFNETFEVIQEDYKKDMVYLSEVSSYVTNLSMVVPEDKKVVLEEINAKLSEIQNRYHTLY